MAFYAPQERGLATLTKATHPWVGEWFKEASYPPMDGWLQQEIRISHNSNFVKGFVAWRPKAVSINLGDLALELAAAHPGQILFQGIGHLAL